MLLTLQRFVLLVAHLLVGVSALIAGTLFVADPTGGRMGMPLTVLRHAPFDDFLLPGLVLGVVVGGSALFAAWRTWQGRGAVPSVVAGVVLLTWIFVQILLIRELNGLQLFCLGVGLVQVGLGWALPGRAGVARGAEVFLAHRRIALIGLSSDPNDFSHIVRSALELDGHAVVGVRRGQHIDELPDPPAAAIVMVPPEAADAVTAECVKAGVEAIWFHRGVGTGAGSEAAVNRARTSGLAVVTDACPLMYLRCASGMHRAHRWTREHA